MVLQYNLAKYSENICRVYSFHEDEQMFTTVMEYSEDPCYFEDLLDNVKAF
jgi:hypothetical protein